MIIRIFKRSSHTKLNETSCCVQSNLYFLAHAQVHVLRSPTITDAQLALLQFAWCACIKELLTLMHVEGRNG